MARTTIDKLDSADPTAPDGDNNMVSSRTVVLHSMVNRALLDFLAVNIMNRAKTDLPACATYMKSLGLHGCKTTTGYSLVHAVRSAAAVRGVRRNDGVQFLKMGKVAKNIPPGYGLNEMQRFLDDLCRCMMADTQGFHEVTARERIGQVRMFCDGDVACLACSGEQIMGCRAMARERSQRT
jgi:hypothetical protein